MASDLSYRRNIQNRKHVIRILELAYVT